MMMKSKATTNTQNKLMKIITMPIKALAKARDFYVRSMNNYADKVCYGAAGWGGASYGDPLPRSFSTNSIRSSGNDEDMRELIRAASTSKLGTRIDLDSVVSNSSSSINSKQERGRDHHLQGKVVVRGVPRSASVGMAKIEEDKPCDDFGDFDDILVGKKSNNNISGKTNNVKDNKFRLFPRSRSYGVGVGGGAKTTTPVF